MAVGLDTFATVRVASAASASASLSTAGANEWLVGVTWAGSGAGTISAGTNAFLRQAGNGAANLALLDSNAAVSSGSVSMGVNSAVTTEILFIFAAFKSNSGNSIAFDAKAAPVNPPSGAGTTQTWSHTCTGANRLLVVGFLYNNSNLLSVKYAGASMTKIGQIANGTNDTWIDLWYILAPATGANNVVATWGTSEGFMQAFSSSYTGVEQPAVVAVGSFMPFL